VCVSIRRVVYDPAQVAQDAEGEEGGVDVPVLEDGRNAAVQLFEEASHGCAESHRGLAVVLKSDVRVVSSELA
jgi:hypothetical protein